MKYDDFMAAFGEELNGFATYATNKVLSDWHRCCEFKNEILGSIQSIWYERELYLNIDATLPLERQRSFIKRTLYYRAFDLCVDSIYPRNWLPGAKTEQRKRLNKEKELRKENKPPTSKVSIKETNFTEDKDKGNSDSIASNSLGPEDTLLDNETNSIIWRAVAELPKRERLIIMEKYIYNNSGKNIAKTLGVSPARITQLYQQALKRLKSNPILKELIADA